VTYLRLASILCCSLLAIACATPGSPISRQQLLADKDWLAEDIGGRGVIDYARSSLEFSNQQSVSGSGGCNRYSGDFDLMDGDRIRITGLAWGEKACPPALTEQEARFFKALFAARSYTLDSTMLVLYDDDANPLIRFSAFLK